MSSIISKMDDFSVSKSGVADSSNAEENDFMGLGEQIKERRKLLKISAEELATRLGVITNTVYRWENGEREPNLDMLSKIAEVLEVPVAYLFDEDGTSILSGRIKNATREPHHEDNERDDAVTNTIVLLRTVVKNKDDLPESDKEILRNILKYGLKALEDDPEAEEITNDE